MTAATARESVNIVIGGTGIEVISGDAGFLEMLHRQYADFVARDACPSIRLEIDVTAGPEAADAVDDDAELRVRREGNCWNLSRGDFEARYDPGIRRGVVRQSANRHSIDSVIRIIHTLTLANDCGFLLHSASAIRNGRAFLFAGRSGAGKTTLSRHVPPDACLLSDEVSYVRKSGAEFQAWGTPFTGELGTPGANRAAPIEALCFLRQAAENRLVAIGEPEALQLLLTNVLFFAHDAELVARVFDSAGEFVARTKAFRLEFTPGDRAWELVR
jgi:hypothetical protein